MNLATISNKLATVGGPKVHLALAKANKYSPQILTGVGLAGSFASTFMIAKSTLKLPELVDNHEMGLRVIHERTIDGAYESDKDRTKDITYLYLHSGLDLVKLYGPGVGLFVASAISIAAAQGISQKRQVALVAALKSSESAFQAYRARVIEEIGAEKEADIRYGVTVETIEDENGKKSKVTSITKNGLPAHIQFFEPGNKNFERGKRELNMIFLDAVQNHSNDRLNAKGYVYLNEVLEWLGIDDVPAGQVIGWRHKDVTDGDGYIDFGIGNPVNGQAKRFIEGLEDGILLDFNVDGEIMSKL